MNTRILFAIIICLCITNRTLSQCQEKNGVPFEMKKIAGKRPIFKASVNGFPANLMFHSNASFYLQLNHAFASQVGIDSLVSNGSFGISKPGKVSELGRDSANVSLLQVGINQLKNVPASIFEVPDGEINAGMAGVDWIKTNRIVIDYKKKKFFLNPKIETLECLKAKLSKEKYISIPIKFDSVRQRYLVKIEIGGLTRNFTLSTVAFTTIDSVFAVDLSLKIKNTGNSYGGPTGSVGFVYENTIPLIFSLVNHRYKINKLTIEDMYAYIKETRTKEKSENIGGILGADFLVEHKAIIDFGNETLYLKE
ncbi:hypothetical protein SAMN05421780_104265 [Flexibacter flexilis DSM 6793]|uniref:Aspartyl protease n=2 Tax=Flexibacter flexilis TaxID=998 RepID=A0A1I1I9Z1_9BACT|nr:hypothetical protein SAMN05421780_104265 [Flexibacter flexilis DSM 6793]